MQHKLVKTINDKPCSYTTMFVVCCIKSLTTKICISDGATRLWNIVPMVIEELKTIYSAKKAIKDFVKTLPI